MGTASLIILLLPVHKAAGVFTSGLLAYRKLPLAATLLGMAGVVLIAASASIAPSVPRHLFILAGMCLWLACAVLTFIISRRRYRRRPPSA